MFVRLCETLTDKGRLIPATEDLQKYINSTTKDYYVSLYKYNQKHKEIFESKGTVAGINDVVTNKILFDFDSPADCEIARKEAAQLVERLKKLDFKEEHIGVWFSGNKGIHVEINTDKSFTPTEAKTLATKIAGDFSSFDSVVYNASRIIRVPNTAHPKTGLFKTKISIEELNTLTVDQIKDISKEQYKGDPSTISSVPEQVMLLAKEEIKNRDTKENTVINDFNQSRNPFKLSLWKLALFQGFYCQGQRSHALMILAATLKNKGLDREETLALLKEVNLKQSARHNQEAFDEAELEKNVIGQVYGLHWQGKTYSEDNFSLQLQDYLNEIGIQRGVENKEELVIGIDQGFDSFIQYAESIDKNTIKLGIESVDRDLNVQTGRLYAVLGPPGAGKTSFVLTALTNTSKDGLDSMFCSYDMSKPDIYQKLIQRHFGLTRNRLYDFFRSKDERKIKEFKYVLQKEYSNVHFCFRTSQKLDEIRQMIKDREQQTGRELKLVVIDYLELIESDYSEATAASAQIIQGLRSIAIDLNKAVIVLLQPNKMSSTIDEPLLSYNAAKGSASIAQAVSAMLTLHRPGYSSRNPEGDIYFSLDCVKNRNGPLFSADLSWDGLTGIISELDETEKEQLKQLRALKASHKKDEF